MPPASLTVTHVHRLALDDGPGLRTTVFLKGCPLACAWCHNPESLRAAPQVSFAPDRCLASVRPAPPAGPGEGRTGSPCRDCLPACARGALGDASPPRPDAGRCDGCGRCADACPSAALRLAGVERSPAEVAALVLEDRAFHATSGGGVTFSGGEPTLRLDALAEAARLLHREGTHVALETAGTFAWEPFREKLLPYLDLVLFDLKLLDPEEHRRYTGAGNAPILRSFEALCADGTVEVVPRVPLVPGITATERNLAAIARFVRARTDRRPVLLPYNPAGAAKRRALGMPPAPLAPPERPMTAAEEEAARRIVDAAWSGAGAAPAGAGAARGAAAAREERGP